MKTDAHCDSPGVMIQSMPHQYGGEAGRASRGGSHQAATHAFGWDENASFARQGARHGS